MARRILKRRVRSPSPSPSMESSLASPPPSCRAKRSKYSHAVQDDDGEGNKENVPLVSDASSDVESNLVLSPREARAKRREKLNVVVPASRAIGMPQSSRTSLLARRLHTSPPSTHTDVLTTPTKGLSRLTVITPPITPNAVTAPSNFARARALLREHKHAGLTGRDVEHTAIHGFLADFIAADHDHPTEKTALYVSGAPGTGKTALLRQILLELTDDDAVVPLYINCMGLQEAAVWDRIVDEMHRVGTSGRERSRAKSKTGKAAFEALLDDRGIKCVVVLDEIDHLASSSSTSSILATMFSLPVAHAQSLRVIGISNTHTLTAMPTFGGRDLKSSTATLHFAPYTAEQMIAIASARLVSITAQPVLLPPPVIKLAARKIATQTGDIRAVFSLLIRALELSEAAGAPTVTPAHVLDAIKAHTLIAATVVRTSKQVATQTAAVSVAVAKVQGLSLQAKLALLALLVATSRVAVGLGLTLTPPISPNKPKTKSRVQKENSASAPSTPQKPKVVKDTDTALDVGALHAFYCVVLSRPGDGTAPFSPLSRIEFVDVLGLLETGGVVRLDAPRTMGSPRKSGSFTFAFGGAATGRVQLARELRRTEVLRGLGVDGEGTATSAMDRELRTIWERECMRFTGEAKAAGAALERATRGLFEEAMEDD